MWWRMLAAFNSTRESGPGQKSWPIWPPKTLKRSQPWLWIQVVLNWRSLAISFPEIGILYLCSTQRQAHKSPATRHINSSKEIRLSKSPHNQSFFKMMVQFWSLCKSAHPLQLNLAVRIWVSSRTTQSLKKQTFWHDDKKIGALDKQPLLVAEIKKALSKTLSTWEVAFICPKKFISGILAS